MAKPRSTSRAGAQIGNVSSFSFNKNGEYLACLVEPVNDLGTDSADMDEQKGKWVEVANKKVAGKEEEKQSGFDILYCKNHVGNTR
jgi:hypothetical protein